MMIHWKHIAALVLTLVIAAAWGLSRGPYPAIGPILSAVQPVSAMLFLWLGVTSPQIPPMAVMMRRVFHKGQALAFCAVVLLAATTTACTAAQWANFVTSAETFASYVQTFLAAVQVIWGLVLPSLGAAAPAANQIFVDACVTATNALAVLQDALHTGDLAGQKPFDLAALMQAVKDAVQHIETIVAQYQPSAASSASLRGHFDTLAAHAHTIAVWR